MAGYNEESMWGAYCIPYISNNVYSFFLRMEQYFVFNRWEWKSTNSSPPWNQSRFDNDCHQDGDCWFVYWNKNNDATHPPILYNCLQDIILAKVCDNCQRVQLIAGPLVECDYFDCKAVFEAKYKPRKFYY